MNYYQNLQSLDWRVALIVEQLQCYNYTRMSVLSRDLAGWRRSTSYPSRVSLRHISIDIAPSFSEINSCYLNVNAWCQLTFSFFFLPECTFLEGRITLLKSKVGMKPYTYHGIQGRCLCKLLTESTPVSMGSWSIRSGASRLRLFGFTFELLESRVNWVGTRYVFRGCFIKVGWALLGPWR